MNKVVNEIDPVGLANQLKSGDYPITRVSVPSYFIDDGQGGGYPDRSKRFQVRDMQRDVDRINRAVNKIKATGDRSGLEPWVIVVHPDGHEEITGGAHTSEIQYLLGDQWADAYIVKFDEQLGSSRANQRILGNQLNVQDVEKVDVHDTDIKNELYEILKEELEASETEEIDESRLDEIKKSICSRYPHVTNSTVGQWISNHGDVGGRSTKTLWTYTEGELDNMQVLLSNLEENASSVVLRPRVLRSWMDTGVSEAIYQMADEEKQSAVVPLYIDNVCWKDKWENTNLELRIKERYDKIGKHFCCDIKYKMLRYQN